MPTTTRNPRARRGDSCSRALHEVEHWSPPFVHAMITPAQVNVCPNCKSDEFERTDDGALACIECGMQLVGVREEINETGGATATLALGASMIRRKVAKKVETTEVAAAAAAAASAFRIVTVAEGFEAFQCLLQTLVTALVTTCGLDAELRTAIGRLWILAMQTFPAVTDPSEDAPTAPLGGPPVASRLNGHLPLNPRGDRKALVLGPPLALALCYLGCLEMRLPVMAHDLVAWCESGELPLLSAHRLLPKRLQHVVHSNRNSWKLVKPQVLPKPRTVALLAAAVCERLRRPPPPPPPPEVVASRAAAQMVLSPAAVALAHGALRGVLKTRENGQRRQKASKAAKKGKAAKAKAKNATVNAAAAAAAAAASSSSSADAAAAAAATAAAAAFDAADEPEEVADEESYTFGRRGDLFGHRDAWLHGLAAAVLAAKVRARVHMLIAYADCIC